MTAVQRRGTFGHMSGNSLPPPNAPQPIPEGSPVGAIFNLPAGEHLVGVLAAAGAIVSAFLPWLQVRTGLGTFSVNGVDGDGQITLLAGIVGLGAMWKAGRWLIGAAICGAIIGGIGIWHYYSDREEFEIGIGLYGTAAGGIVLFAMAMSMLGAMRRQSQGSTA